MPGFANVGVGSRSRPGFFVRVLSAPGTNAKTQPAAGGLTGEPARGRLRRGLGWGPVEWLQARFLSADYPVASESWGGSPAWPVPGTWGRLRKVKGPLVRPGLSHFGSTWGGDAPGPRVHEGRKVPYWLAVWGGSNATVVDFARAGWPLSSCVAVWARQAGSQQWAPPKRPSERVGTRLGTGLACQRQGEVADLSG